MMPKEYSAGAVIYRKTPRGPLFLFVLSRKNGTWGFPKGHVEGDEDEHETVRREVAEEAGLGSLTFVDGFREEIVYNIISKRPPHKGRPAEKHAVYFLCASGDEQVVVDGHEIVDYRWAGPDEGAGLIAFDALRDVFAKAVRKVYGEGV
ncbi:MAG: NUDIX domain-containing protein [Candidatus Omnitrophica bacterium]|nr:NUDIX domain-containing protein [Candidatus Omnitrophota bacterium]